MRSFIRNPKWIGYALSALVWAGVGGFAGFITSMWGGIYEIMPICIVLGALFGLGVAYVIELIILTFS